MPDKREFINNVKNLSAWLKSYIICNCIRRKITIAAVYVRDDEPEPIYHFIRSSILVAAARRRLGLILRVVAFGMLLEILIHSHSRPV